MKEIKIKKYKGSILLRIALLVTFVFLVISIVNVQIQIAGKKSELEELNTQIATQSIINDGIRFDLEEYSNGDEKLIEDSARKEFGMAKNGEQVFEIIGTD